jgi:uncharacterized membrane protein
VIDDMEASGGFRRVHLLNGAMLVWIWAFTLLKWPDLPEKIPVHFAASGAPDGWTSGSWEHWFLLPLASLALTLVLYGSAALAARYPRFANIPRKQLILALTPAERKPILDLVTELVYRIAVLVNIQFSLMQLGTYQVAKGLSEVLPWYVRMSTLAVVALTLLLTVTTLIRLRSLTDEVLRASSQRLGGPE